MSEQALNIKVRTQAGRGLDTVLIPVTWALGPSGGRLAGLAVPGAPLSISQRVTPSPRGKAGQGKKSDLSRVLRGATEA